MTRATRTYPTPSPMTRAGGPDELHNHLTHVPTTDERESCGGCAQLANDFLWIRFHDATAARTRKAAVA